MSSPNFQPILDAALDSYAKQTGIDLTKHPSADKLQNCRSPADVLQILSERESAFKDYRDQYRNLIDCVRPVVQAVHALSTILGEIAGLRVVPFQPTKAIFVGIDVLLSAAIGVSTSYDALADLFDCVSNFLRRFQIYAEKISLSSAMSDIVIKIMTEVLSVLALATKQINQGRFKKFAKKLLGENDIEAVLQRLDRLTQEEARVALAHTLELVHGLFDTLRVVMDDGKVTTDGIRKALVIVQETADRINKLERNQFQENVRRWLSPPDPSTNHNIARRNHRDGITSWFTQSATLKVWKETGSLLWIHGKPGSGKTVLCSEIIQQVECLRDMGLAHMTYFYCDFRDSTKQQVVGLLASLLAQLSAKSDPCYNILSALYSEYDAGTRQPGDDKLIGCLEEMLSLEGQPPTYIIIDGLDECPGDSDQEYPRERVLEYVERLVALHLPNVRICVTSRPEADIQDVLTSLASHAISLHDEQGQKKDIDDYVGYIVYSDRRMRKWRNEDKELVVETLSRKACGMFRWVVCQLEALRRCFPSGIRLALDKLPMSLDETYDRILLGISRERQEYAQRLFQCLAESIQPLRTEELAEILAIRFNPEELPHYNTDWSPPNPEEAVLSACSSLITVVDVNASRVVQFSHFSVKEYLSSERLANAGNHLSQYHIRPDSAHTILAQSSLSVLLAIDDQVDKERMKDFPFAIYAARYWVDHAQFDGVCSSIEVAMEQLFDKAKSHFSTWVWIYDIDHKFREIMYEGRPTPPPAVPLYYATLCGFRDLIKRLLITYPEDVNARGGVHVTPLHAAVAKGNVDVMVLLLEHGANVGALKEYNKCTPLHDASVRRRLDEVSLLLGYHADVNAQDTQGRTPLFYASVDGELEIARELLRHGAAADISNEIGFTPLMSASRQGHADIVCLLLQSGAAVDLPDNVGWTPLISASRHGKLDVVRLLLENGASVDSQNDYGFTSLMLASQEGHLDIVHLLLKDGASLGTRNNGGWTALMHASRFGHPDVVHLLLQSGAAVDLPDNDGWTPLISASRYGKLDVVRLLLENGASVDSQNDYGFTSLMLASEGGHLDIVHLLLKDGASLGTRKNGWTALMLASRFGHPDVVHLLLQSGRAVDFPDNDGWTPLMPASYYGQLDVVRLLLQNGASVDSQDNDGSTSLMCASQEGHLDIVRLLLKDGASFGIRDNSGQTALFCASVFGYPDIVHLLLQSGAAVDPPNNDGWTPLMSASRNGQLDVVRLLLQNGASVDSRNIDGLTPLMCASEQGYLDIVHLLLLNVASVNSRDNDGWTPLMLTSRNGHADVVQLLLQSGAPVGSSPNDIWSLSSDSSPVYQEFNSPLHLASISGHPIVAELLIQYGADVNTRNQKQETPLDLASAHGKLEIVHLLLTSDSSVNSQDAEGSTPLHRAAQSGHLDIVTLLFGSGADVNIHNNDDKTALDLALDNGRLDVARKLSQWMGSADSLDHINLASLERESPDSPPELARVLLGCGNGPNIPDETTSLHAASEMGDLVMMRSLLETGADVNERDSAYATPLVCASEGGKLEVVKLLIEYGADLNLPDWIGWTPLHAASRNGHVDVVHLLLDLGADPNAKNQNQLTALHFAIYDGSFETIKALLEQGANVHVRDELDQTLFQTASRGGNRKLMRLLSEYGAHEK